MRGAPTYDFVFTRHFIPEVTVNDSAVMCKFEELSLMSGFAYHKTMQGSEKCALTPPRTSSPLHIVCVKLLTDLTFWIHKYNLVSLAYMLSSMSGVITVVATNRFDEYKHHSLTSSMMQIGVWKDDGNWLADFATGRTWCTCQAKTSTGHYSCLEPIIIIHHIGYSC